MSGLRWCAVGAAVAVVCYALGRAACAQTMPRSVASEPGYTVADFVRRLPDDERTPTMGDVFAATDALVQRMRELVALDRDLEAIWAQGRQR